MNIIKEYVYWYKQQKRCNKQTLKAVHDVSPGDLVCFDRDVRHLNTKEKLLEYIDSFVDFTYQLIKSYTKRC